MLTTITIFGNADEENDISAAEDLKTMLNTIYKQLPKNAMIVNMSYVQVNKSHMVCFLTYIEVKQQTILSPVK